jgi:ferric-dicitrate binding protein FerR (iron transport regulator)
MVVEGTVLYVQEGRFELQSSSGECRLFVLSHRAALEPQQLTALQRAQARVRVRYEEREQGMWVIAHEILADDRLAACAGAER